MKKRYLENGYAFILSNDYDKITKAIHTRIYSGHKSTVQILC